MARRHEYSQHFLRSPQIVAELVGHTNIRKNDVVYDLGAGSGVITDVLASKAKEVVAVEVEPGALEQLRTNMRFHDNVTIIEKDILDVVPDYETYKIMANPPFSIITPMIRYFASLVNRPKALFLIVQKQFALKTVPSERHFTSQLGVQLAPYYTARIRKPLKRTDFTPPPAVDTVLLELKMRDETFIDLREMKLYWAFVERCFTDPRELTKMLDRLPSIPERRKPSELSVELWVELYSQRVS